MVKNELHARNQKESVGFIKPACLKELWFHTGTNCNLHCPFCFEGSGPGINRIQEISLPEIKPYIHQALELGVEQFSFTGGEPFVNPNFLEILNYCLDFKPVLVLTNGTQPFTKHTAQIEQLKDKAHQIQFRISIDFPEEKVHDANRGAGTFNRSMESIRYLVRNHYKVSIARHADKNENSELVLKKFKQLLSKYEIPDDINIVAFPDLYPPGSKPDTPQITTNCMKIYKDEEQRQNFMCYYSKMIIKQDNQLKIFACTLVDDDEQYNLGSDLCEAMEKRINLTHHRCYSCFSMGTSCTELVVNHHKFEALINKGSMK